MEKISIHCRYCRKSLKLTYLPTGISNKKIAEGLLTNCPFCNGKHPRDINLGNITESVLVKEAVGGKFFI